ncbi:MAG TPA: hypothetical protein VIX37_12215 [Candidatus Sulfotelmatobacter sp.]
MNGCKTLKLAGITCLLSVLLLGETVNGKWEIRVEGYGEPRTQKFDLKQKGDELSGIYAGKLGESKVSGSVKDAQVEFEFRAIEKEHIITIHYTGTVKDQETMQGTVTFGDLGKGTWTATRGSVKK